MTATYDKEFLLDLSKVMPEHKTKPTLPPAIRKALDFGVPCAYHKHDKDKPCGKEVMRKVFEG